MQIRHRIGPFDVLESLGQGGMGVVYRGRHRVTGELAAIKTVRAASEAHLSGLRREIHALAAIRHPGVVRIIGEGVDEGLPWYAMDLLEGLPLSHFFPNPSRTSCGTVRIDEDESLDPAEFHLDTQASGGSPPPAASRRFDPAAMRSTLTLIRRICDSLAYLHGEGIIHCDLKPDNVLVRPDASPVLVDFGLASTFAAKEGRESLDSVGDVRGTVTYMAPEQLRGELLDARTDLYALGCILFEALCGRPPFLGDKTRVVFGHLTRVPVKPSSLVADVPAELDALVERLLAKHPRQRIGHANDVAAILGAAGAEAGPSGGPRPRDYLYRPGFAGRQQSVRRILEQRELLESGQGGIVLVGGESGAGKTRLVMEAIVAARDARVLVLAGECTPPPAGRKAGAGPPLHVFAHVLRGIADKCTAGGRAETERLLGPRGRVLAAYEPSLAGLPGQEKYPAPTDLPAGAARLRLFAYLAETLASLAAECPIMLVLDDLQWADELSLGFLRFLADGGHFTRMRLLLVATYRTEEAAGELAGLITRARTGEAVHVDLTALEERDVAAIVTDMLASDSEHGPLTRYLSRQSQGNPFFVAEFLRAALEENLLWRDDAGQWRLRADGGSGDGPDFERLTFPRSLRGLVRRRIEALPPPALAVATATAVAGLEAATTLVARVAALGEIQLMEATGELLRRNVIEEAEPGRLRFTHDSLREMVYEMAAPEQRARMHRAVALAIEALGEGEAPEALHASLGRHWEEAGEPARARPYYLAAARAAAARFAHTEAERLYVAFFGLGAEPSLDSIAARNELGSGILRLQGRAEEAIEQQRLAVAEARAIGDRMGEGRSLRLMGSQYYEFGELEKAAELFERALAIAVEVGDRHGEGVALGNLAIVSEGLGRTEDASILYERALLVHRETGDRRFEGITLGDLAILRACEGRMDESRKLYERALAIHREVGNRRYEAMTLGNLSDLPLHAGDLEEARRLNEQALAIHREIGNRRFEGVVIGNLAAIAADLGHVEEARDLYAQSVGILAELNEARSRGTTLAKWAILERRMGRLVEAERMITEAEPLLGEYGTTSAFANCMAERGYFALIRDEPVEPFLEQLRALAERLESGTGGMVGNIITTLEAAAVAKDTGEPLYWGERFESLPPGFRALVGSGTIQTVEKDPRPCEKSPSSPSTPGSG